MLVGNLVSILSGGTITVVVSLIRGKDQPPDTVWENTRDIDNPLRPWSDFYVRCIRFHLDLNRVQLKPNSITLASSELAPNMFGASSELAPNQLA